MLQIQKEYVFMVEESECQVFSLTGYCKRAPEKVRGLV